jgi:tRNA threonylcarbamoyladenosine biosynthesis protein TsaE
MTNNQSEPVRIETRSPEQTEALGCQLGKVLEPGDIVTLSGELGGGKTCFVRGIVAGAAPASIGMVASPTFAILNEYPGPALLLHYDCYRLHGSDDAIELGLEDHLYGTGICLIEWPDRITDILPDDRLDILFEYVGETERCITFIPRGPNAVRQVKNLQQDGLA